MQTGLTFDFSIPQDKPVEDLMAPLAASDYDLREQIRSGIVEAKSQDTNLLQRRARLSDRHALGVSSPSEREKVSQCQISEKLQISETTVNEILKREVVGYP